MLTNHKLALNFDMILAESVVISFRFIIFPNSFPIAKLELKYNCKQMSIFRDAHEEKLNCNKILFPIEHFTIFIFCVLIKSGILSFPNWSDLNLNAV
jgi:hypothetical protein